MKSIKELLNELGGNEKEIAQSLRAKNIKGVRNSYISCPIANYLRTSKSNVCKINTSTYWSSVNDESFEHPQAVTDFIIAFDDMNYPDLIENE
jgi:hypothetical protein